METIKISSVEKLTAKTGKPYCKIETADGRRATCWNAEICDSLRNGVVGLGSIEINDKGFTMLTEFKAASDSVAPSLKAPVDDRQTSFKVAYAKDLAVALLSRATIEIPTAVGDSSEHIGFVFERLMSEALGAVQLAWDQANK